MTAQRVTLITLGVADLAAAAIVKRVPDPLP